VEVSLPFAAHLHLKAGVPLGSDVSSQQVLTSSPVVYDGMPSASIALFVGKPQGFLGIIYGSQG
jgi:hypothetical protein